MLLPDSKNRPHTAQTEGPASKTQPATNWMERARRAYYASTSYVDANYRKQWEDSIRAFNNQHSSDSKYNQPSYDKRSKVFRPKTRTVIRKNEAAAAAAFFSTLDVTNVSPQDANNKAEQASSEVMKELMQYRLTKTIPWYQTVLGGLQDSQTTGVACAHVYWDFRIKAPVTEVTPMEEPQVVEGETEYPPQSELPEGAFASSETGFQPEIEETPMREFRVEEPKVLKDEPVIDLIPVENIRIDPGANWTDPINTSPYVIHLIPMYAQDVRARMNSGEWIRLADDEIAASKDIMPDTTRIARNRNRDDPYATATRDIGDYEIVWVQRHIHRYDEEDWEFYTLGDIALLTEPRPLGETVLHGKRPYIMGCCILETHRVMPSSIPVLSKGLQDETNEIANQRLDNIKFVLNKKYLVKRGKEADVPGLVRNVPGGVVLVDDPENDVKEMNWPDVTASSFEEHKELSAEMDELLGNFNPAAIMMASAMQAPARNMAMLNGMQGTLTEYLIRTYVETFVQPVLRHLMLLEQHYETDANILALAGKRAQLFQRFGIDQVTDDLLSKELTLTVNVGMGATDPMQKLNKFILGVTAYMNIVSKPIPGLNTQEVAKEIFGNIGFSDGSRFTTTDNPQVAQLQAQLQEAMNLINQLQAKVKEKQTGHIVKLQTNRENNLASLQKTMIQEENENKRALATHFRAIMEYSQPPKQKTDYRILARR